MTIRRWLGLVLAAGLLAFSANARASMLDGLRDFLFGGPQSKQEAVSVEDPRGELAALSEKLAALDIPVADGQIDAVADFYESIPKEDWGGLDLTRQLLYEVGRGDWDYDTGDWTPTSHRVYAFDAEVLFINRMYTDFLKGVAQINRGEFLITDVEEDVGKADWDTNTGTQAIRFKYNGHPYEYAAAFRGDWIDMGVVAFLNDVFEREGNPKRLYCFGDQIQVMFYDAPEWAARFTEATGQRLYAG